jgi:hypothetical protein
MLLCLLYLYFFCFCENYNYFGFETYYKNAVSKLSLCLDSVGDVTCYVISDNFPAVSDTNTITLVANQRYNVISSIGCLNLNLNIGTVNIIGTCNFNSLKV